jgi:uncharacterized protein YegL
MQSEVLSPNSALRSRGVSTGLFAVALQRDKGLKDLCSRGGRIYRPFELLMSDIFAFFYDPLAGLGEAGNCDKLHYLVMKYLVSAPEYAALRARSGGRSQQALTAAEEFGTRLLDHLSAQHIPKVPGRDAATSTEPVDIQKLVLTDVASAGVGSPARPGVLVLAKHVEVAIETSEALADVCYSFGISPGEIRAMPIEQRRALAGKMGKSGNLRRFAEIVGRWSKLAVARRAKRTPGVPEELSDVTYGDDWHLFVPQELGALANSALRYDFYLRLIDRRIVQYDPQSQESTKRGPIIACVDTSGSMAGEHDLTSKAVALALRAIARKEHRPFAAILFSSRNEWISFLFRDDSVRSRESSGEEKQISFAEGVAGVATFFFGGGTDYECPLFEALKLIDAGGADWREADVVFITDDYCEVSDEFTRRFASEKDRLTFKVFSLIVGARAEDAITLRRFSDRVVATSELDEAAVAQIFDSV